MILECSPIASELSDKSGKEQSGSTRIHIPEGEYIGAIQAAERLGVTRSLVLRYLRQGRIDGIKMPHGWIMTQEAVEVFKKLPPRKPGPKPRT